MSCLITKRQVTSSPRVGGDGRRANHRHSTECNVDSWSRGPDDAQLGIGCHDVISFMILNTSPNTKGEARETQRSAAQACRYDMERSYYAVLSDDATRHFSGLHRSFDRPQLKVQFIYSLRKSELNLGFCPDRTFGNLTSSFADDAADA